MPCAGPRRPAGRTGIASLRRQRRRRPAGSRRTRGSNPGSARRRTRRPGRRGMKSEGDSGRASFETAALRPPQDEANVYTPNTQAPHPEEHAEGVRLEGCTAPGETPAAALAAARRIVVKIGSALLVAEDGEIRRAWLNTLVDDIARCR